MTRSLRSYRLPVLVPAFVLGLCSYTCTAAWGADTKDAQQVDEVDAPPAAIEGLEVRMTSPARYVAGERLKIAFKFTNIAREGSFALYNKLFDSMYADDRAFDQAATIIAINRETKESFRAVCVAEITRQKRPFPTVRLGPGQSWVGRMEFSRHLQFRNEASGQQAPDLPPGNYRMTVAWKFETWKPPVEDANVRWWTGKLETKPVEFEIAKPAK